MATIRVRKGRLWGYACGHGVHDIEEQMICLLDQGVAAESIFTDPPDHLLHRPREGFAALVRELRAGDTLFVGYISLLGRSLSELVATAAQLRQGRIQFVTCNGYLDTRSEDGQSRFALLADLAKVERTLNDRRAEASRFGGQESTKRRGREVALTSAKEDEAVRRLRAGEKVPAVAKAIGVSRSTLYAARNGHLAQRLLAGPD